MTVPSVKKWMKKSPRLLGPVLVASVLVIPGLSGAEDTVTNPATRNILITKFEHVLANIAPSDPSRPPVLLRLADLLAERGRVSANEELDRGCTVDCNAGLDDRTRAIRYYQEAAPTLSAEEQNRVHLQIGHLKDLMGDVDGAIADYRDLLKKNGDKSVGEVVLALGEIHFRKRKYSDAAPYFEEVMKNPQHPQAGLGAYRLAWCQLNLGENDRAVETLISVLKTPALLSRNSKLSKGTVDPQFHEQVALDLATFMGRAGTKEGWLSLYDLGPEGKKEESVAALARELERLGNRAAALSAWKFYQNKEKRPEGRIESHVHLAELYRQSDMKPQALEQMDSAQNLWLQSGCTSSICTDLKTRWRLLIVEWNKSESKKPTEFLHKAYDIFGKVFNDDHEMALWAFEVAKSLSNWKMAYGDSQKAIAILLKKSTEDSAKFSETLEKTLMSQIEMAELSKQNDLREKAYAEYLAKSPTKSKATAVHYQMASLLYEGGKYSEAATAYRETAQSKVAGDEDVKNKAAHLALDSLVLAKMENHLVAWSTEFAQLMPTEAAEFHSIGRKAVLTQAANQINGAQTAEAYAEAKTLLASVSLDGADEKERATYYKNQLILAEKAQDFRTARQAAGDLLAQNGISVEDRKYALGRKAWFAELSLDFKTAFDCYRELKTDAFRTATMAEMAGLDPVPYYQQFLKESDDNKKKSLVAARLVKRSAKPLEEFSKHKKFLMEFPELAATIFADAYIAKPQPKALEEFSKEPKLAETALGKLLRRDQFLQEFGEVASQVSTHKLDTKKESLLAASLKKRIAMVEKMEALAKKAVGWSDWSAQVVALTALAHENERLYTEILSLPIPEGLDEAQQGQYMGLLSEKAGPFHLKASDLNAKVSEFWKNDTGIKNLQKELAVQSGASRTLLEREWKAVANYAPGEMKAQFVSTDSAQSSTDTVSATTQSPVEQIESARQAVRDNPFAVQALESLIGVEKSLGHELIVGYLESRLQEIKGGQKP